MPQELKDQLLALAEAIYQAGVQAGGVEGAVAAERARIASAIPALLAAEEADLEAKLAQLIGV